MQESMRGPRLKIRRAKDHLKDLRSEILAYLSPEHLELTTIDGVESDDRFAAIRLNCEFPESIFSIVSDNIYQLRSALDQAVSTIGRSCGAKRLGDIYFPFAGSHAEYLLPTNQKKIQQLPEIIQKEIEGFRPYRDGDHELWALSRLNNLDKHSDLIPIGSMGGMAVMSNVFIENAKTGVMMGGEYRLDEGVIFSNLGESGTVRSVPGKKAEFSIRGSIVFGAVDVFEGRDVAEVLELLLGKVENIVDMLDNIYYH